MMQEIYRSGYLVIMKSKIFINTENANLKSFFLVKTKKTIFGKSKICRMTEVSGARDKCDYDGKTLLSDVWGPECNSLENNEKTAYFLLDSDIIKLATVDKIKVFISNVVNNMMAVVVKNNFFWSDHL